MSLNWYTDLAAATEAAAAGRKPLLIDFSLPG